MIPQTLARDASGAVAVPLRWVTGLDAVATLVYHRLRTRRGTALDDIERGLPWWDWLERLPVPLVEIRSAVRAQLLLVPGVLAVPTVTASRTDDGGLLVSATVQVRIGEVERTVGVQVADPYQTSGPPLLLTLLG